MTTRTLLVLVGLVTVLVAANADPAAAHPEDEYEFTGGGWGHGVGMSQYGARGMALNGYTYDEIITTYYTGVAIKPLADVLGESWVSTDLWIGLDQDLTSLTFTALDGALDVCQAIDGCGALDLVVQPNETWVFETADAGSGLCRFRRLDPPGELLADGECNASITWPEVATGVIALGREYRRGSLQVRTATDGADFHAMVQIGLEEYLYGLGEMPSSWPAEALKAQAVAGRTYAAHVALVHGPQDSFPDWRQEACWCHLYDSSTDQNYAGWSKEAEGEAGFWGALWVAAIDATADEVVTHPGGIGTEQSIVKTYYSSSTGGATENNEDVWGGAALPYVRSVPDPWSVSPEADNPLATWSEFVTAGEIASAFGWMDVDSVELLSGPPNSQFEFRGSEGEVEIRNGAWIRATFGARSPYVDGVSVDRFYPFPDIEGTGHADAITAIWEAGITLGCGGGLYCPNDPVTRAQMASFVARALELADPAGDHFSDDTGNLHEENINLIHEAGVTDGCAAGLYCPEAPITRGQMAKFLVNALPGLEPGGPDHFSDDDGHRFETHINAIAGVGISLGCDVEGTSYCPDDPVTRAQMASFLARAFIWG